MVIVSKNLERTNENDGLKMTALEFIFFKTQTLQMVCVITQSAVQIVMNALFVTF